MTTFLLVEWEGLGFYAKTQRHYAWSFTADRSKAATYKSEKIAIERAAGDRYGTGHNDKPWRLVKVDGNFDLLEEPGEFRTDNPTVITRKPLKGETITLKSLQSV